MRATPIADGMRRRRSHPAVAENAPSTGELLDLIEAAACAADHGSLRPWRLIALRDDARERLGSALVLAEGAEGEDAARLAAKPLRAPLLLAIVVSPKASRKVADWEQEAAAAGVAHALSLLLDEAGWAVMWRSGAHTRSAEVHRMHELAPDERLLGWLYVGGRLRDKPAPRRSLTPTDFLTTL